MDAYCIVYQRLLPTHPCCDSNTTHFNSYRVFNLFFGQNLKVTNDALVQSKIDDYFRGRVFAVYDVVVNGAIVSGGVIAALLLPPSGASAVVPLTVSAAYLLVAARLLRPSVFPPVK